MRHFKCHSQKKLIPRSDQWSKTETKDCHSFLINQCVNLIFERSIFVMPSIKMGHLLGQLRFYFYIEICKLIKELHFAVELVRIRLVVQEICTKKWRWKQWNRKEIECYNGLYLKIKISGKGLFCLIISICS